MESCAILLRVGVLASCNLILVLRESLDALRDTVPLEALTKVDQPGSIYSRLTNSPAHP